MSEASRPAKPPKWIPFLVGGFPFGIIILGIIGLFFYFKGEEKLKEELRIPYNQYVNIEQVTDFFTKINELIGDRYFDTDQQLRALRQVSALIDGTLGEENTGFPVLRDEGTARAGGLWYRYSFDIKGEKETLIVPVMVSYLGVKNENGEDLGAAHLSIALTVAQSMLDVKPDKTVRFVFFPSEIDRLDPKTCLENGEFVSGSIIIGNPSVSTVSNEIDLISTTSTQSELILESAIALRQRIAELAE